LIVGAGAAGLAAAIFAARRNPRRRIVALDGAKKIGAKILVSGGGRCNVTNRVVTEADFFGGSRNIVRRILRSFPAEQAVEFFQGMGVSLHEEDDGKLFPDSHSAKTVLHALTAELTQVGACLLTDHRVTGIERRNGKYWVSTPHGPWRAQKVVLATGGLSLPKTGSDGTGYNLAQRLGHSLVCPTPALVPLVLDGDFHVPLSGISQNVELTLQPGAPPAESSPLSTRASGKPIRLRGAMLWTHFGVSGPVVLNMSRFWHRTKLEGVPARLSVNFLPGDTFETAEKMLIASARQQPRTLLHNALAGLMPARFANALLAAVQIEPDTPLAHLSREDRRRLVHTLLDWPLNVRDSRGYSYAEVTAGGIPLDEIQPSTMESRVAPGLFLVGEILNVDGRIGGFNFQWAWSSGFVAASGL
jgi:hypothetical protein